MRIVTAYDLGVFAAQRVTQQKMAQDAWIKRAVDPLDPTRPEVSSFVVRRPLDNAGLAARYANINGLQQPGLDKLYGPSKYTGFKLKPVQHGLSASRVPIVTEYQVVATGPDGGERVITNIKSTGPQSMANTNPSNINRLVEQAMAEMNVQPGPKPRPRPQPAPAPAAPAAPAPAPVAPAAPAPTPMPVPPAAPAVPPPSIPEPAPAPAPPAAPVSTPAPAIPPPPTPEAGPNGLNAGDYVPPAAPEPEPISELAPPTLYPRQADPRSREGQAVDNENARRQEEYDQTLKQRQEVGNSPQDYEEQVPAAPPEPESSIVSSRDVSRESAPLDPLPGVDDSILPPPAANPNQALADSTLLSGVLRSSQATSNEAPYISALTENVVPGTPNSSNGKLQDQVAGPAMYADPAKQLTQSQRNGKLKPYNLRQDVTEMSKIEEEKRLREQPSMNDLGFYDPSYVPQTATPTSEPTYGKKPLTRAQQSVGNVGAFSQAGVAKTRKQEQQQAKSAPAAAAPTAPSVPVTPPQPPIPTPEQPKPTPPPVPPPAPKSAPTPAPQYRPSAPAAPAYRPPAQAAPAPRQTIGGGLFGRRRR